MDLKQIHELIKILTKVILEKLALKIKMAK